MTRRHFSFDCEGAALVATLDDALGATALLIVSGGNEVRAGAWNGQAQLAARIAAAGWPVLRFDRRGVGDSEGANAGFRHSAPDIAAARAALRAASPQVRRVVALGNCDAASALMLGGSAGFDGLVLTNPWTIEGEDEAPPPAQLRAHYRRRLASPAAILRVLRGEVRIGAALQSLVGALRKAPPPTPLAQDMAQGLARFTGRAAILLAERDRTAAAFAAAWERADPRIAVCAGASHSFVEAEAREWLDAHVLAMLAAVDAA